MECLVSYRCSIGSSNRLGYRLGDRLGEADVHIKTVATYGSRNAN